MSAPAERSAPPAGSALRLGLWIWRDYLARRWPLILLAFVLMAIEGGTLGVFSWLVRPMFDDVFGAGDRAAVVWVAATVAGVFWLRAAAAVGQRTAIAHVGNRTVAELQSDLVRHLLRLDGDFYQMHPPGELIERVRGDSQAVLGIWASVLGVLGRDVIAVASLLAVALSIDWLWTLIAVLGAPLFLGPLGMLQRFIRRVSHRSRTAAAELAVRLDEIFHGIVAVKLARAEDEETRRFAATARRFARASVGAEAGQAAVPALMDVVAGLGFFGVLIYGGYQIIDGNKSVGEFMSFFTAMGLVFEPLRRLGGMMGAWQAAAASLARLRQLFDAEPAPLSEVARPPEVALEGVRVVLGGNEVLRGVTFTAAPGRTTALVGLSGAGKTTVFNVITRLVDPVAGEVRIGGVRHDRLALADLRSLIAVVSQDAALFDDSIAANIRFGRPDASDEEVRAAAEAALVTEFADRLPQGLETPVGPRGSALSGGQRQRVAIARAILRDAPILLLDEPTSALDSQAEALVQRALERLARDRTTLVIAHRLATIADADHIVVMDRGEVVETGRHEELVAANGLYAALARLQFRGA